MSVSVGLKATTAGNFEISPPDEEEQILAKVVFGDTSDFQSNLKSFDLELLLNQQEDDLLEDYNGITDNSEAEVDENEDLNQVQDDQLFYIDEGEGNDDHDEQDVEMLSGDEDSDFSDEETKAEEVADAWQDSDDETLAVSVIATNKTKKLRTSYNDSSINGKDYVRRLRAQFEQIYPRPKWADDVSDDESSLEYHSENSDSEEVLNGDVNALSKILQSTYAYKDVSSSKLLPSKILDITRLKDANASHPSHSAIQCLSFHPHKPLLLTGGYDRTLRLYHIDGKSNHMVTSVYLKGTPIQTCTFYLPPSQTSNAAIEEQKIFSGGRRRYMHSWDLSSSLIHSDSTRGSVANIDKISRMYGHEETQRSFEKFKVAHYHNFTTGRSHGIVLLQGNNGWINILHATTGVWMLGCKINGVLADFCIDYEVISKDKFKTILIVANTYSEIWEFDLNDNGKVLRKWKDEGGIGVTTIQVGGGTNSNQLFPTSNGRVRPNRWLAIGSESGYVNIYDRNASSPIPVASLDQLTTTISTLQFSPDGQILCMASRAVKDALRLVHLPTFTIFSNWPTSGTPLGKVTSAAFSPRGEILAVGNEQGKIRLWRLNHY